MSFSLCGRTETYHRGLEKGSGGHCNRNTSDLVQGCEFQGSGTSCGGRGAALWRNPQGEDQAAQDERGCADSDGDANSEDFAYESYRNPGYERAGGAAYGSCADSDLRDGV